MAEANGTAGAAIVAAPAAPPAPAPEAPPAVRITSHKLVRMSPDNLMLDAWPKDRKFDRDTPQALDVVNADSIREKLYDPLSDDAAKLRAVPVTPELRTELDALKAIYADQYRAVVKDVVEFVNNKMQIIHKAVEPHAKKIASILEAQLIEEEAARRKEKKHKRDKKEKKHKSGKKDKKHKKHKKDKHKKSKKEGDAKPKKEEDKEYAKDASSSSDDDEDDEGVSEKSESSIGSGSSSDSD